MTPSVGRSLLAVAIAGMLGLSPAGVAWGAAPKKKTEAAQGEPVRVGVLPLVLSGDVAVEVGNARDRMSQRVLDALADPRFSPVLLEAEAAGDAETPYCNDAVCWQTLATQHRVSHFIVVVVRFTNPDYQVDARLIDGRDGAEIGGVEDACDLCGLTELGEHVGDVASSLRRELEATLVPAPVLVVTSTPPGATVWVDGETVGVTPMELRTVAGRHRVEVEHPGFVTERLAVKLVEGTRREVDARLRSLPVASAAVPSDRKRAAPALLGSGIAGIVLGSGGIAGGVAMLMIHDEPIANDCSGDDMDALGRCRYLHDTRAGGIAMTAVGAGLVAAGIVLTVLWSKRRGPRRGEVVGTRRGVAAFGRF